MDIIRQWNWVDVVAVIILFRICYISVKSGLPAELFKFLGTISAVYLSMHYYRGLADFVRMRLGSQKISLELFNFVSFLILVSVGYLVFFFLRQFILRLIKIEAASILNRWLGLLLGVARGLLLTGLIVSILVISNIGYLKKSAGASYSARHLFKLTTNAYSGLWHGLMCKFMPQEKFNQTLLEIQESLVQKQ